MISFLTQNMVLVAKFSARIRALWCYSELFIRWYEWDQYQCNSGTIVSRELISTSSISPHCIRLVYGSSDTLAPVYHKLNGRILKCCGNKGTAKGCHTYEQKNNLVAWWCRCLYYFSKILYVSLGAIMALVFYFWSKKYYLKLTPYGSTTRTGNIEKPIEYLILVLGLACVGINNGDPGITNTHFLKSIFSYFFFAVF